MTKHMTSNEDPSAPKNMIRFQCGFLLCVRDVLGRIFAPVRLYVPGLSRRKYHFTICLTKINGFAKKSVKSILVRVECSKKILTSPLYSRGHLVLNDVFFRKLKFLPKFERIMYMIKYVTKHITKHLISTEDPSVQKKLIRFQCGFMSCVRHGLGRIFAPVRLYVPGLSRRKHHFTILLTKINGCSQKINKINTATCGMLKNISWLHHCTHEGIWRRMMFVFENWNFCQNLNESCIWENTWPNTSKVKSPRGQGWLLFSNCRLSLSDLWTINQTRQKFPFLLCCCLGFCLCWLFPEKKKFQNCVAFWVFAFVGFSRRKKNYANGSAVRSGSGPPAEFFQQKNWKLKNVYKNENVCKWVRGERKEGPSSAAKAFLAVAIVRIFMSCEWESEGCALKRRAGFWMSQLLETTENSYFELWVRK